MALLRLYLDCLKRTAEALRRNAWTLVLPTAYLVALQLLGGLLAPLGLVGGLLLTVAATAAMASFLYFVSELAGRMPVRLRELGGSVRPFFWPVMNFLFVLWIGGLVLGPVLRQQPALHLALQVVLFLVLNAVPEVIHRGGAYGSLEILSTALQFIQTNWLEWYLPNLAFGALYWLAAEAVAAVPGGGLVLALAGGPLLHAVMVFRGFLFEELRSSNPRQRALRYKLGR